ncbi:hypothetical protein GFC29_2461 [Anoxybacillus sp. B7M1]|uniref:hypothetical protein n=1 Tax=unclassified Anoxybacillus TaxID=2639704 RepID=UPI0005CCC846|nr:MULTISPECIES: hypothetical protein [unclassified Anoxybacillus]ANB55756.1 hypothetical protein GFC28_2974 [Anoxybacillus sp. B2M1]ANB63130.1 hypothetical protein GFC29_2461 [Anoxybacillus sp. B7M1]
MNIERHFLALMLGQSLANIGDVLYIVGVMATIYRMTESADARLANDCCDTGIKNDCGHGMFRNGF